MSKILLSVSFLMLFVLQSCIGQTGYKNVSAEALEKTIKAEKAVLIDVRTPSEIQSGYIPLTSKFIDFNGGHFESEIKKLDKNVTYVLYCRSGGRSAAAAEIMAKNGFKKLYNLSGGISGYSGGLKRP